jgi:hypothetical protein
LELGTVNKHLTTMPKDPPPKKSRTKKSRTKKSTTRDPPVKDEELSITVGPTQVDFNSTPFKFSVGNDMTGRLWDKVLDLEYILTESEQGGFGPILTFRCGDIRFAYLILGDTLQINRTNDGLGEMPYHCHLENNVAGKSVRAWMEEQAIRLVS